MKSDCRNDVDSRYYMCAGMYAMYLNESMLVKIIATRVSGFFTDTKSFRSHYSPKADSASNRNEYQENFLGVKPTGAYG